MSADAIVIVGGGHAAAALPSTALATSTCSADQLALPARVSS